MNADEAADQEYRDYWAEVRKKEAETERVTELQFAIIRERQLIALYLHGFAGSQVDPVEVANAVLTGAHMVAT